MTRKTEEGDDYYHMRTKAAVAGVRGTEFIVAVEPGEKEWKTQVHTFEGRVELAGDFSKVEGEELTRVEIPAGTYAAFIMEAPYDFHANAQ